MYSFKANSEDLFMFGTEDFGEGCSSSSGNYSDIEGSSKFSKKNNSASKKSKKTAKAKKSNSIQKSSLKAVCKSAEQLEKILEAEDSEIKYFTSKQALDSACNSNYTFESCESQKENLNLNNHQANACDSNNNENNNNFENKNLKEKNENALAKQKASSCEHTIDNVPFFESIEAAYNFQGNYQNYISRVIQSLAPLANLSFQKHIQERIVLLPEYNKKKTLILDLDETLIHADFDGRFENHDQRITFLYDSQEISVNIFVRPGVFEFLKAVSEIFEIFIFTASKKEYADAVLDFLDPEKMLFKHRLYRDSCIPINNRVYVKDLSIFVNRKPENIILIDNSFYSFCNQPRNGVLINSFYNDKQDRELINLLNYLQNYLYGVPDVRVVNEQIFNFENLMAQYKNMANEKEEKECFFDD